MGPVVLKGLFFQNARGMRLDDTATLEWTFDSQTNTLTADVIGGGPGGGSDGLYTPTLTNAANLDGSAAFECQYIQVGDTVHVSGKVTANPTAPGVETRLGISLPVASNLGAEEDCAGVAFSSAIAGQGAAIRGDAANNRAEMVWIAGDLASQPMYFSFMYQVI